MTSPHLWPAILADGAVPRMGLLVGPTATVAPSSGVPGGERAALASDYCRASTARIRSSAGTGSTPPVIASRSMRTQAMVPVNVLSVAV